MVRLSRLPTRCRWTRPPPTSPAAATAWADRFESAAASSASPPADADGGTAVVVARQPLARAAPPEPPAWPGVAWEADLPAARCHPGLPRVLDHFADGGFEYLVLEVPAGRVAVGRLGRPRRRRRTQRYGWLTQVAELLHELHRAGAMLEGLRPDIVVVTPTARCGSTDLSDLLPLPLPGRAPVRGRRSTPPGADRRPGPADARADLYSFGAHALRPARRPRADRRPTSTAPATPSRSSRTSPTSTRRSAG